MFAGIKLGIGIGIGLMAVKEAKKAYDKYMVEQKIKGVYTNIKKAWNDARNELRDEAGEKKD